MKFCLRSVLRSKEKGGKCEQIAAHDRVEEYMDAYLSAAGIAEEKGAAVSRTARDIRLVGMAFEVKGEVFKVQHKAVFANWCAAGISSAGKTNAPSTGWRHEGRDPAKFSTPPPTVTTPRPRRQPVRQTSRALSSRRQEVVYCQT